MGRSISQNSVTTSSQIGAEVAQIFSATGYQAGDLVYNKNGTYGAITDTEFATATFSIIKEVPYVVGGIVGGIVEVVERNNAGSLNSQNAAKLSNGNIVVVWRQGTYTGRTTGRVYFKITDVNNNEIIAPTIVSSMATNQEFGMATVVALSGGGFAVIYNGTSSQIYRAVYDNDGALVTAEVTSGATFSTLYPKIVATPTTNGGFAAAWFNTGTAINVQIYDSTGTVVTTTTLSLSAAPSGSFPLNMTARLNGAVNEVCVVLGNSSSAIGYIVYNAVTGAVLNNGISTISVSFWSDVDVCVNTTDNNYVIAYLNNEASNAIVYYRTLNASYTLGAQTTIDNINSALTKRGSIYLKSLSSGGFYVEYNRDHKPAAYVYNGTYVKQNSTSIIANPIQARLFLTTSIIQDGNALIFYRAVSPGFSNTNYGDNVMGLSYVLRYQFNLTTLEYEAPSSSPYKTNTKIGNTSPLNVNGYVRSASTTGSASFYAASTSTQSTTITETTSAGNFVINQTTIDSTDTRQLEMSTLSNGNVVAIYGLQNSPFTVKYKILTQNGSLVKDGDVGTSPSASEGMASLAALPNGKFVVIWYSASSTLSYSVYSNDGSVLSTGILAITNTIDGIGNGNPKVSGLVDNRFVVVYRNSTGSGTWHVFDDTGVRIANNNGYDSNVQTPTVIGYPSGGFFISNYNGNNYRLTPVAKTATNTYGTVSQHNLSAATNTSRGGQYIGISMDGRVVVAPASAGSSTLVINIVNASGSVLTNSYPSSFTNNVNAFATVLNTGEGDVVVVDTFGSPARLDVFTYLIDATNSSWMRKQQLSPITASTARYVAVGASGYGVNVVVGLLNTSNNPTFAVISNQTTTYTTTLTGGVSISNPITISPYDTGHYLTGVSLTSCSPNAVGTVQVNGQAQLNTNYSASTSGQYFDFTSNPAAFGVRGSVSGRTVTMVKDL